MQTSDNPTGCLFVWKRLTKTEIRSRKICGRYRKYSDPARNRIPFLYRNTDSHPFVYTVHCTASNQGTVQGHLLLVIPPHRTHTNKCNQISHFYLYLWYIFFLCHKTFFLIIEAEIYSTVFITLIITRISYRTKGLQNCVEIAFILFVQEVLSIFILQLTI